MNNAKCELHCEKKKLQVSKPPSKPEQPGRGVMPVRKPTQTSRRLVNDLRVTKPTTPVTIRCSTTAILLREEQPVTIANYVKKKKKSSTAKKLTVKNNSKQSTTSTSTTATVGVLVHNNRTKGPQFGE